MIEVLRLRHDWWMTRLDRHHLLSIGVPRRPITLVLRSVDGRWTFEEL